MVQIQVAKNTGKLKTHGVAHGVRKDTLELLEVTVPLK
jgi:hypothetical protein